MTAWSRRDFSKLLLTPAISAPLLGKNAFGADAAPPHFFIFAHLLHGADTSYLLDARRLALTAAGKMQNYTAKEPAPWVGANGTSTLCNAVAETLREFKDLISVVNGTMMAIGNDGHEQNFSFLLTGSPFGGASMVPQFNLANPLPLDAINTFLDTPAATSNNAATLTMFPKSVAELGPTFASAPSIDLNDPTYQFLAQAMATQGYGTGLFSAGAMGMLKGFNGAASLTERLKLLKFQIPQAAPDGSVVTPPVVPLNLQIIEQFFKRGLARSVIYNITGTYDTHDPESCSQQPAVFAETAASIVKLIRFLKNTPYDESKGQSLLDVTTVMIGSEFMRTMRQLSATSIDKTGTDHNPLTNSFILFGKGIKGGQVIGASDLVAVDQAQNLTGVSGAHKGLDPQLIKLMGRPFDFETGKPVDTLPEDYDAEQYLSIGAVANTLLDAFGIPPEKAPRRRFSQGGKVIPSLKWLLS